MANETQRMLISSCPNEAPRNRILSLAQNASVEISLDAALADLAPLQPHPLFIPSPPAKDPVATTIARAVQLKREGFTPVPHIAARNYETREHLEQALRLLQGADIDRILLIAGDKQNAGAFANTLEILQDDLLVGRGIRHIAFAGHPDGNPNAPAHTETTLALKRKNDFAQTQKIAGSIVTQLCFDAKDILGWAQNINGHGSALPVIAGIYGPLENPARLVRAARLCGFRWPQMLKNAPHMALAYADGAVPARLILDYARNDSAGIAGLHVFSFGNVRGTAKMLGALEQGRFKIAPDIFGKPRLRIEGFCGLPSRA